MTKTATSLFGDHSQATATVSRLEQAGISRSNIAVMTNTSSDLSGRLSGFGVPPSDAHTYAEGVRRGGSLIAVIRERAEGKKSFRLQKSNCMSANAR
jgi:hypothetical protein